MPQTKEKIIKPESVVLRDGRKGYFISGPIADGAVIVVKSPSGHGSKKQPAKIVLAKKTPRTSSSSVLTALKEVQSRKSSGKYPSKNFDALMDEL